MSRSRHRFERLLPIALIVSLLGHGVLFLWLGRTRDAVKVPAEPLPIELTWQEVPPALRPEPAPLPPPPAPKASATAKATRGVEAPARPASAPDQPAGDAAEAARVQAPPRTVSLTPRIDVLPPVIAKELPHGRTIHPEDLPSQAEVNAEIEARVGNEVERFARDRIAEARVQGGLVDPYYADLRRQIAAGLEEVPDFSNDHNLPRKLARAWYGSWQGGAGRYGATGSPYAAPPGRAVPEEVPSALQREVDRGSSEARELAQALQMGARFRDFGDGKLGAELYAVVEVRQAAAGSVENVILIEASGVPQFDAWVLDRAGTAAEKLAGADAGATPQGRRSAWAFTGRISYRRSMKDVKLAQDGWYLALASIPGLLTGNFDEVSGKVDYIDLRHPHYEARVKLLRVYDANR